MSDPIQEQILEHLKSAGYRPQRERGLADALEVGEADEQYHAFRDALKELQHAGRVVLGAQNVIMLPPAQSASGLITGTYRHNKRGFGFVVPSDPMGHADLFIPEGHNAGAMTGDTVRANITNRDHRDGKQMFSGKIVEVVTRSQKRFVGTLAKRSGDWFVLPDGNALTEAIATPDAGSRHVPAGTKVVVELTSYPGQKNSLGVSGAVGVITEVLGAAGEKDVDLKAVIVQFNLPGEFPDEVKDQARHAMDHFDPELEKTRRLDLTDQLVCTIDPDDAKDYDDAISLRRLDDGLWELGVHIADVSHFVPAGSPLDVEAKARGNSCYFPGHVIPMLPEVLSNGVCSLQEGVPRLCKSAFITYDEHAKPIRTKFANTVIHSAKRLRYREAQAILDKAEIIPHPQGDRRIGDYEPHVVRLLHEMNRLAKRIQKRRIEKGQINLDLPEIELVLDENGKVVDAVPEDQSYTHTLIEMFMVEANEAVARLLDSLGAPFLRRTHPAPENDSSERLRHFVTVAGFKMPKDLDRKAIQGLLLAAKGKPESFAINRAVLRSLSRAEYSPKTIGHYALASEFYGHFTSPIRRYADLTIHRLLDAYFEARQRPEHAGGKNRKKKLVLADVATIPTFDDLVELGRHISFTERRADEAERELRQVKVLELLQKHVGEVFPGIVTGIANFGVFIQLQTYQIDGLIRYENLLDDWWDVDERAGIARAQRTGRTIGIGDTCTVIVAKVDPARRELDLAVKELHSKTNRPNPSVRPNANANAKRKPPSKQADHRGGASRRNQRSKQRGRR